MRGELSTAEGQSPYTANIQSVLPGVNTRLTALINSHAAIRSDIREVKSELIQVVRDADTNTRNQLAANYAFMASNLMVGNTVC